MKDKLLIVDDQPGIRLLLTDIFTCEGYEIIVARNGKEALEQIHRNSFDLIMLDYNLPIINGRDVLRQMTEDKIIIPVILMSGLIERIKEEEITGSMVIQVVSKPFNIKEICELVRRMIA